MVYAGSKEALRKSLEGIAADVQGADKSEVSQECKLRHLSVYALFLIVCHLDVAVLEKAKRGTR